jgi:hypothetical protein
MIDEYLLAEEIDPALPLDAYMPVASHHGNGGRFDPPRDVELGDFEEDDE